METEDVVKVEVVTPNDFFKNYFDSITNKIILISKNFEFLEEKLQEDVTVIVALKIGDKRILELKEKSLIDFIILIREEELSSISKRIEEHNLNYY